MGQAAAEGGIDAALRLGCVTDRCTHHHRACKHHPCFVTGCAPGTPWESSSRHRSTALPAWTLLHCHSTPCSPRFDPHPRLDPPPTPVGPHGAPAQLPVCGGRLPRLPDRLPKDHLVHPARRQQGAAGRGGVRPGERVGGAARAGVGWGGEHSACTFLPASSLRLLGVACGCGALARLLQAQASWLTGGLPASGTPPLPRHRRGQLCRVAATCTGASLDAPPLPQVFKVLLDGVQPHAAKVMYLGQAAEAEEAFVREASLLKQLRHRNIVGELPPVGGACDGLTWKGGDRNAWAFKAWRGTACSLLRAAEGLTATRRVPACRPWLRRLQRREHHGAARGHHPHGRSVLGGGRDHPL